jgi:histone deacetylase 1/2
VEPQTKENNGTSSNDRTIDSEGNRSLPVPTDSLEENGDLESGRVSDAVSFDTVEKDVEKYLCELAELGVVHTDEKNAEDPSEIDVEPSSYDEAWNHPNPIKRKKWRAAITKEFVDMKKRAVWSLLERSQMPTGRRCVKCRWVFKIKRSGVYRARLVACGYSQIPGVDFTDNYSPVVNDVTFRLLLVIWLYYHYTAKIVDVETAFLYGKLEEDIYMECPPGLEGGSKSKVCKLNACIYGLVQAARQYYKHIVAILKKIGFTGGLVDPCLFSKVDKMGTCYVVLYVDDNLIIGDEKAVQETITQLQKHGLIPKIEDNLNNYLSCEIVVSEDRKRAWLGQPHLISNLEKKFGEETQMLHAYVTPGTPGLYQLREKDESLMLPMEQRERYRSGVGMLLYLVKHSRPDIANAVRELSKVLDCSTKGSYKEMLRCIKYVLDTRIFGLKIWPSGIAGEPWDIICFTDSDYASDPETRRSVSGYIIYVHGVPVCFRSKGQKCVTLSSCEAEWIALSEAIKDVVFLLRLCESMMLKIRLPITVRVDNVGAIFLSENITTSNNTKHVDIRSKWVKEYCENGTVKILFVRSENNDSDIMTKNLPGPLHSKHSSKLVVPKT